MRQHQQNIRILRWMWVNVVCRGWPFFSFSYYWQLCLSGFLRYERWVVMIYVYGAHVSCWHIFRRGVSCAYQETSIISRSDVFASKLRLFRVVKRKIFRFIFCVSSIRREERAPKSISRDSLTHLPLSIFLYLLLARSWWNNICFRVFATLDYYEWWYCKLMYLRNVTWMKTRRM